VLSSFIIIIIIINSTHILALFVTITAYQWRGLRPSILGQNRSETKKNRFWFWSWSCRSDVLWNTVLSRSSS